MNNHIENIAGFDLDMWSADPNRDNIDRQDAAQVASAVDNPSDTRLRDPSKRASEASDTRLRGGMERASRTDGPTTEEQVREVARRIVDASLDITDGYEAWRNLGFALAHEMGEGGRPLFHDLSRMNPKYDTRDCDRQYDACLRSPGSGITIASFFQMAKDAGIDLSEVARMGRGDSEFSPVSPVSPHGEKNSEKPLDSTVNKTYITDNKNVIVENNDNTDVASSQILPRGESGESGEKSVDEGDIEIPVSLPTFTNLIDKADWCPFIQKAMATQTDTEAKDMIVLATVATLSSVMPNYFGLYDGMRMYAPLYLTIVGASASGKGDVIVCRKLVEPIDNEIRAKNQQECDTYQKELAAWNSLDKSKRGEATMPKQPPYRSLFMAANSSSTAMCQSLSDNNEEGLIFESEGNTMANSLKSDYGNYSDMLCKAFQHEPVAYSRRKDDERVNIRKPRLAVVITMTPKQVPDLIQTYEPGLGSRIWFYNLPRKLFWRDVFEKKDMTNEEVFQQLGVKYFHIYHALSMRHGKLLQFKLSAEQEKRFNEFFSQLQTEQVHQLGDDLVAIVRRLGLTCFRTAMILTMLRRVDMKEEQQGEVIANEDQAIVCDDRDFNIAITICNCLISHSSYVYASLVPSTSLNSARQSLLHPSSIEFRLFNLMPQQFTTKEYYAIAAANNVPNRTADRHLGNLCSKYRLVNRVKNGLFEKIQTKKQP